MVGQAQVLQGRWSGRTFMIPRLVPALLHPALPPQSAHALSWFVTRFFREVPAYLGDGARRAAARDRVASTIAEHAPQVVLAHSLGSVVAYEALWAHPELPVDLLVTLGSPLGMPDVVFDRLEPTPRGPVKLTWFVVGSTDRDASARPRGLRRLPVMRPPVWRPPVEPSPAEQAVIRLVRRAKLFVWLRAHRHELFDEAFQAELAAAWADSPKGQPPVPPALLALATILQAYTGASDDGVIEATVMDRGRA